jgi:hypothetical protein
MLTTTATTRQCHGRGVARRLLLDGGMRTFLALVVAVAIIGGFLKYRQRSQAPLAVEPSGSNAGAPNATPAQWPKSAIDRATDVKRQVAKEKSADATP